MDVAAPICLANLEGSLCPAVDVFRLMRFFFISGGECSLRAFITDYVRSGESERLASEARAAIEAAMKPAAWRERAPPDPNNTG